MTPRVADRAMPDEFASPPIASGAEQVSPVRLWLRLLSCTILIERRLAGALRMRFGTTLARFDLLAQLAQSRDSGARGLTMSELSRRLMVSNGNVTGLVSRLEAEGLISRRTSTSDRRAQIVCLTPEGERALEAMIPEHHAWLAQLFEDLSPEEREQLHHLIGSMKSAVERAPKPGAPE
ncbi:MAG TPA: MarR family transcriptional regulator [Gemmatimonadaceae bacterium]|nr:MarR family transcriptional regulator [Gemmatimonadaceae bacterium]